MFCISNHRVQLFTVVPRRPRITFPPAAVILSFFLCCVSHPLSLATMSINLRASSSLDFLFYYSSSSGKECKLKLKFIHRIPNSSTLCPYFHLIALLFHLSVLMPAFHSRFLLFDSVIASLMRKTAVIGDLLPHLVLLYSKLFPTQLCLRVSIGNPSSSTHRSTLSMDDAALRRMVCCFSISTTHCVSNSNSANRLQTKLLLAI